MGSETSQKLPVIDFTNINLENCESVKSQVYEALVEFGCFEATYDKIPLDLRKAIFGAIEEVFNLPPEKKLLEACNMKHQGYVGQSPYLPLFESLGIDHANNFERVKTITNIWWPEGNLSFSKTIHSFTEQLTKLDQMIRSMILKSLGVEKYMEEHLNSTDYLLRVMKYKCPQGDDKEVGLVTHRDQSIMTILYQNQVGGLEVMTKDEKWISYKPSSPDSFVVVIGDSLNLMWLQLLQRRGFKILDVVAQTTCRIISKAWSNGRLHAPFHRVMMSGNETRYSLGLFTLPKDGCIVKAPDELVDEEHPLLFKPFDFAEFLNYCYTEKGFIDQFPLRTFSGV